MLSSWKKSASADRAQSTGTNHRVHIGEEAGPPPAIKRHWAPRPGPPLPFISARPSSCTTPHSCAERCACFIPVCGAWQSLSSARQIQNVMLRHQTLCSGRWDNEWWCVCQKTSGKAWRGLRHFLLMASPDIEGNMDQTASSPILFYLINVSFLILAKYFTFQVIWTF